MVSNDYRQTIRVGGPLSSATNCTHPRSIGTNEFIPLRGARGEGAVIRLGTR